MTVGALPLGIAQAGCLSCHTPLMPYSDGSWNLQKPADCTSLGQVEACALREAKTDEWLSGIQVQASGVRGDVSGSSLFCAQFSVSYADCVLCKCWAILLWALCWVWGSSKDRLAGESDQPQQKPRTRLFKEDHSTQKGYPGQAFGQSSSLQEQEWDSVESNRPGSLSWQTNV